jgi:uncharacterized surface protein with fasciclin (FAS1) repeats
VSFIYGKIEYIDSIGTLLATVRVPFQLALFADMKKHGRARLFYSRWAAALNPGALAIVRQRFSYFLFETKLMADIVDIAVGAGSFTTLVTAVQAAGLVETLKSPGPFTVFAPNDEAFAKLPPGTITTLVQNIPQLSRILTFHVVPGKLMQADLQKKGVVTSVEGSPIPISSSGAFEVKNATVLAADIEADNGVIHVLDTVILMG